MKRRITIILIFICVLSFTLLTQTPAKAVNLIGGSLSLTCSSFTTSLHYAVNRDNTGTGNEHYGYVVTDGGGNIVFQDLFTDTFSGTDNFTDNFAPQSSNLTLRFMSFAGNSLPEEVYVKVSRDCSTGTTFFNPGDGRVDPRPNERIAVWCDAPNIMTIWGIGEDSKGKPLARWTKEAIAAAGPKGLSKNLGPGGTISVSVNAQGQYYAAWNGQVTWSSGNFLAIGRNDFAKFFTCEFTNTGALGAGNNH